MGGNPANMSPEEIVRDIQNLRDTIHNASARLLELSRVLYHHARRERNQTSAGGVYLTYANAWTRFAGMVSQGIQRTRSAERVLGLLEDPAPDTRVEQAPAPEARSMPVRSSALEDLIAVYGEEVVGDADQR